MVCYLRLSKMDICWDGDLSEIFDWVMAYLSMCGCEVASHLLKAICLVPLPVAEHPDGRRQYWPGTSREGTFMERSWKARLKMGLSENRVYSQL